MQIDFLLVAPARSGTNLVAFALDSHPNIAILGDNELRNRYTFSQKGQVKGLISYRRTKTFPKKLISLTRDPYSMAKSLCNTETKHFFQPAYCLEKDQKEPLENDVLAAKERQIQLLNWVEQHPNPLILSYEEITHNQYISEIPEKISNTICKYLNVSPIPLFTKTFKPKFVDL